MKHRRLEAEMAFDALLESLKDLTDAEAWAVAQIQEGQYLHTDGTVLSIIQHLACCRVMYASVAFRNIEYRWQDCVLRLKALDNSVAPNIAYLRECQEYWLASWVDVTDAEEDVERGTIWGKPWPTWKIIAAMTQHDTYHAGQITMLRSILPPTNIEPQSYIDNDIKYLIDSPYW